MRMKGYCFTQGNICHGWPWFYKIIPNSQCCPSCKNTWYASRIVVFWKSASWPQICCLPSIITIRHAAELHSILHTTIETKSILCIYSDGGPDHRLTYVSLQQSLIALFLNLDLDLLVACQTAPNHSWRNPIERVMLILTLHGLWCVGLMRLY